MKTLRRILALAGLALLMPQLPAAAQTVEIHPNQLGILLRAGWGAYDSGYERAFCLVGHGDVSGRRFIVDWVYEPEVLFRYVWSGGAGIVYRTCPAGTIADAHTHPIYVPTAFVPSETDQKSYFEVPHQLHFIVYPRLGPDGLQMGIMGWREVGPDKLVSFRVAGSDAHPDSDRANGTRCLPEDVRLPRHTSFPAGGPATAPDHC